MSADYAVKLIPAVRLTALTDTLDPAQLEQRIGPMFDQVQSVLGREHASLTTPIATYTEVVAGT